MNMEFFTSARPLEQIYWICAIVGTLFFILRTIMMIVGADTDIDSDGNVHAHLDDSGHAFEFISVNSITAFVMMLGWSGLTTYKQFNMGNVQSIVVSFIVGLICMFITAYLFQLAKKLVSPGDRFDIHQTIGLIGTVQQMIPSDGTGRVAITLNEMTREINAVSENKIDIASFTQVTVTKVITPTTVAVKKSA